MILAAAADAVAVPFLHGSLQRTDADSSRSQVRTFVDLQYRIQLVLSAENFLHLIGGHRIQTAAEGIQLNQFQIVAVSNELSRLVQAGVIHPLVQNADGTG